MSALAPDVRKHEVLIVDDDPAIRSILSIAFERRGIDTNVAENGQQALRLLQRKHGQYCCVLLDLNVPAPDGIEIARYIRDHAVALPVVVISGHPELAAQMQDADLASVVKIILMKPVDTSFLVGYVHGSACIRTEGPHAQRK